MHRAGDRHVCPPSLLGLPHPNRAQGREAKVKASELTFGVYLLALSAWSHTWAYLTHHHRCLPGGTDSWTCFCTFTMGRQGCPTSVHCSSWTGEAEEGKTDRWIEG